MLGGAIIFVATVGLVLFFYDYLIRSADNRRMEFIERVAEVQLELEKASVLREDKLRNSYNGFPSKEIAEDVKKFLTLRVGNISCPICGPKKSTWGLAGCVSLPVYQVPGAEIPYLSVFCEGCKTSLFFPAIELGALKITGDNYSEWAKLDA